MAGPTPSELEPVLSRVDRRASPPSARTSRIFPLTVASFVINGGKNCRELTTHSDYAVPGVVELRGLKS